MINRPRWSTTIANHSFIKRRRFMERLLREKPSTKPHREAEVRMQPSSDGNAGKSRRDRNPPNQISGSVRKNTMRTHPNESPYVSRLIAGFFCTRDKVVNQDVQELRNREEELFNKYFKEDNDLYRTFF